MKTSIPIIRLIAVVATLTLWCVPTIKAQDWAGTYKVKSFHSTLWVTRDYYDNFEMTIERVGETLYITSMFGEDLKQHNNGGFVINLGDNGEAIVDVSDHNTLRLIDKTTFMYKLCIFDEQYYNRLSEWKLKMNADGSITVGTFFVASYQWSDFLQRWNSENIETMYYDMTAGKIAPTGIQPDMVHQSVTCRVVNHSLVFSDEVTVVVHNAAGGLVYSGRTHQISHLPTGVYLVRMNGNTYKMAVE